MVWRATSFTNSSTANAADDNEEALKVRLEHYVQDTKPLLDFYANEGLLQSFDSLVGKEQLFDQVSEFLKK